MDKKQNSYLHAGILLLDIKTRHGIEITIHSYFFIC